MLDEAPRLPRLSADEQAALLQGAPPPWLLKERAREYGVDVLAPTRLQMCTPHTDGARHAELSGGALALSRAFLSKHPTLAAEAFAAGVRATALAALPNESTLHGRERTCIGAEALAEAVLRRTHR